MSVRVRVPASFSLVVVLPFALAAVGATACDELNRPMPVLRSEPRHACFSEVECPTTMRCLKGPNDVQGVCAEQGNGTGLGSGGPSVDGGDDAQAAPAPSAPAPAMTSFEHPPRPGDLQL